MTNYYKAVRHDYGSFHDPKFKYDTMYPEIDGSVYSCHDDGIAHDIQPDGSCTGCPWAFDADGELDLTREFTR